MNKREVTDKIGQSGLVAVVRADSERQAMEICSACVGGGVTVLELTFTVPHADKVIAQLCDKYDDTDVIIGAGTVMDAAGARLAVSAGAQFIVSPYFDEETVRLCNGSGVTVIPGIMTVREAVLAMRAGADVLKVFPAGVLGSSIISALKAPLPGARFLPTGGVDADNVGEWIKAGAFAVGAATSLTEGAKTGDYDKITRTAARFIENIKTARENLN